ncbi:hypothetical protein F183_A36780 [Bryobacterales bacterium F-183]|nr:hypothetical protein F183_A36780 [Bryobacterales bacterium F-183]
MDVSAALCEAVTAIKLGERELARDLISAILVEKPDHEQALLWFAALAETPQEGIRILERLLEVNPNNIQARETLSMVRLTLAAREQEALEEHPARAITEKALVCGLCNHQDTGSPERCAKCGAIFDFSNLAAVSENDSANEQMLLAAVQKWEQAERHSRTFDGQINLARAYLNLRRSNDALPHLRRAIEIRPDEHKVRRVLEQLRARKLILAVDDSMTVRRLVSVVLERSGYRAAVACDGDDAMVKIREELPDLVLLDVMMPGLNGYQVCRLIRQDERSSRVPVVILSSSLLDRIKGRLAGVNDYLAKPFEPERLVHTIQRHLTPVEA